MKEEVSTATIQRWNDEMWNLYSNFVTRLAPHCRIDEEIVNDGGIWIDNSDSKLVKEGDHLLRISMRYEGDFHFGVDEVDDDNTIWKTFEEGSLPDGASFETRHEKAKELLTNYGCLHLP